MDYIQKDFVQIFSKSWCPYCKKAKELLNQYNLLSSGKTLCNELDKMTDGKEIQNVLTNYTKQKTVPYIFFYSKFIGGYSELYNLHVTNRLKNILQYARMIYTSLYICNICGKMYENKDVPPCNCIDKPTDDDGKIS